MLLPRFVRKLQSLQNVLSSLSTSHHHHFMVGSMKLVVSFVNVELKNARQIKTLQYIATSIIADTAEFRFMWH